MDKPVTFSLEQVDVLLTNCRKKFLTVGLFLGSLISMMLAVAVYHFGKAHGFLMYESLQAAATAFIGVLGAFAAIALYRWK